MKKVKALQMAVHYLVLTLLAAVFIFPFLWMVLTALKPATQVFRYPPVWIPNPPQFRNFYRAMTEVPFFTYLRNTSTVAFLAMLGTLFSCPLAAYSLARIPWRGRNILLFITLGVMMIPSQVTMVPLFIVFSKMKLVGTLTPLYVQSFFGVPYYIFLLRQFFRQLPKSLEDAARIDGCSERQIYVRIMFPLCQPALLTVGLLQVISSWNEFTAPLIYLNKESMYTLQLGLQQFALAFDTQWELLMAASTLVAMPIILLYFFVQKAFIQGITFGGVKG